VFDNQPRAERILRSDSHSTEKILKIVECRPKDGGYDQDEERSSFGHLTM
jgi:hypothetical protein